MFSAGSARALACIGRRLADRNSRAETEKKIKCNGCAKSVLGEGAEHNTRGRVCSPKRAKQIRAPTATREARVLPGTY